MPSYYESKASSVPGSMETVFQVSFCNENVLSCLNKEAHLIIGAMWVGNTMSGIFGHNLVRKISVKQVGLLNDKQQSGSHEVRAHCGTHNFSSSN